MFPDYAMASSLELRLPRPDRRPVARDAEIRLRVRRALNRKAA
jgi:hypothetical protein